MFSKITSNIKVSVVPEYDLVNSYPAENRYVFKYHISIDNESGFPIKVMRRKWLIFDVGFGFTEVDGEGIIGLTPELLPDTSFNYYSNVMIKSGLGTMSGVYLVKNEDTNEFFEIEIPKFSLFADVLTN
ncbi:Co2+/Mg2+ efflux protein ApaG [Chryseobacterium sp.]|uniref:Co2+/Mg2+ efflux protein ApaG n=1 Tax=Chryseobacterium sp. TaxID=1871047 RepID=UPI00388F8F8E